MSGVLLSASGSWRDKWRRVGPSLVRGSTRQWYLAASLHSYFVRLVRFSCTRSEWSRKQLSKVLVYVMFE